MRQYIIVVLVFTLLPIRLLAQEGLYGGAGYSNVTNRGGTQHQNVHITLGYGVSDRLSIEGEINSTLFPYSIGSYYSKYTNHVSLYTVARSKGDTFLKAKFGYSIIEYITKNNNVETRNNSDGITYGIGVGLELKNGDTLEFDYVVLPRPISGLGDYDNHFSSISYKVRY